MEHVSGFFRRLAITWLFSQQKIKGLINGHFLPRFFSLLNFVFSIFPSWIINSILKLKYSSCVMLKRSSSLFGQHVLDVKLAMNGYFPIYYAIKSVWFWDVEQCYATDSRTDYWTRKLLIIKEYTTSLS